MADCTCNNFPASLGNVTFGSRVGIGTITPSRTFEVAQTTELGSGEPAALIHSTVPTNGALVELTYDQPGGDWTGSPRMSAIVVNTRNARIIQGWDALNNIKRLEVDIGGNAFFSGALTVGGAVTVGGRQVINAAGQALYA
jgi:hypothetical protein